MTSRVRRQSLPALVVLLPLLGLMTATLPAPALAQAPASKAPNHTSVANTRHNLTMRYLGVGAGWMSLSRNDYDEVCVYCHTPHGASGALQAPLWNRTTKSTSYQTYDTLGTSTLTQPVTPPGPNSLVCLSCHDGQVAVDSVINMPGSGRWQASQATGQDTSFLDTWPGGPGSSFYGGHGTLEVSADAFNRYGECQSCHSIAGPQHDPSTIPVFDAFHIGTDLRNDHPVGVRYPTITGSGTDFRTPAATGGNLRFFDTNGNSRPDKNEIRLYDSGDGFEVECGSCHDPHGVPSGGNGSAFLPTFLRVTNAGSAVCLTCHNK
jgi:hypothetical protein